MELRALLDVSSFLQSWLVPMLCIVAGTISVRLDASNSRTFRPIPEARNHTIRLRFAKG